MCFTEITGVFFFLLALGAHQFQGTGGFELIFRLTGWALRVNFQIGFLSLVYCVKRTRYNHFSLTAARACFFKGSGPGKLGFANETGVLSCNYSTRHDNHPLSYRSRKPRNMRRICLLSLIETLKSPVTRCFSCAFEVIQVDLLIRQNYPRNQQINDGQLGDARSCSIGTEFRFFG